ncbi:MAG TPA: DUF4129 domain-containing protein [Actinospica sp.]|nr:DUF4129 domain-containing protein [Actinospica sp.]
MSAIFAGVPVTPGRDQAQQEAARELAQGKYHEQPAASGPSPTTPSPTPTVSTPSPTPTSNASHHSSGTTILLVILLIVVLGAALLLVLRRIGKPRKDEKTKKDKGKHLAGGAAETPLFGAALHRHNAEQAAKGGDWQEAIRERFRAVIAVLDERSLLPERKDRTADEAARDAGELLPEHADALREAARAFDEVEYGEYLGTPEGYAVIGAVDDAISGSAVRS